MPLIKTKKSFESFTADCNHLASKILQRRYDLVGLLSQYETYETANDEIERSVEALRGMSKELSAIKHPLSNLTISTFFPLNLPLYSLVLFGIAPSVFARQVYIRPPEIMHKMLQEVFEFLEISKLFANISVHVVPRYIFMDLYASESDVIVFTGKYENALSIHKQCPQALLVYNGSGINPFLLFDDANIDLAVAKAVEMRCFNSGQDCAGPDAFFIPTTLADAFVGKLQRALEQVKVGDSTDPEVRVSRTMKETYIQQLQPVLERERQNLVYGGEIDLEKHLVHPTIVVKPIAEHAGNFHEFFAPVFYVLEYNDIAELEKALFSQELIDRSMYISVFGNNEEIENKLTFARLLKDKIVNDVERGNYEYGGYGPNANFLLYGDQKVIQPVLISRDMHSQLARASSHAAAQQ